MGEGFLSIYFSVDRETLMTTGKVFSFWNKGAFTS